MKAWRYLFSSEVQSMQKEEWDLQDLWAGSSFTPPPPIQAVCSLPSPLNSPFQWGRHRTVIPAAHPFTSQNPGWVGRPPDFTLAWPQKSWSLTFIGAASLEEKNRWLVLREVPASSPMSSPCYLSPEALHSQNLSSFSCSFSYSCCPFFCSFLPCHLLISLLGITQAHVNCITQGYMVYLTTAVRSLIFTL